MINIIDATLEDFVSTELLPQIGVTRSTFDELLNQLSTESASASEANVVQLVAPETNSTHWGSLYSALYQEHAIPHCAGLRAGHKPNPARTRRVTSSVKDFLDSAFPLTEGSHHDVTSYMVYFQNLMMILADGSTAGLQNPAQFVAKIGPRDNPESILLLQNGLHVEIAFDTSGVIGANDLAGINDVQVEVVKSTRSDLEANSGAEKCERYRELMRIAFARRENTQPLSNSDCAEFTARCGEQYRTSGSGHTVYIHNASNADTMATDSNNQPVQSSVIDTLIAALITARARRSGDSLTAGPRIIVTAEDTALTLQALNCAERACRRSLIPARPQINIDESVVTDINTAADIRAEQKLLNQSDDKHSPVNNNEKVTHAGATSINQAVLTAMHHHGFELNRLSKGLPGDNYGEPNALTSALQSRAFA